jgi:UDP-N-acetylglucosamine 2-epimerase (non-hydrolysing)
MVTDCLADYLFITEESGKANLVREGKSLERIHFIGNVMIDNLFYQLGQFKGNDGKELSSYELKSKLNEYVFLTLHRPSNVDSRESFKEIAGCLNRIAEERPIVFPVHPRTKKMMAEFGINFSDRIHLLQPLGFKESLFLWKDAAVVLTDSGGLQEETTALGVPCVTLRENTERPITTEMGTNILGGTKRETILAAYRESLAHGAERGLESGGREGHRVPPLWDGKASHRIWKILLKELE